MGGGETCINALPSLPVAPPLREQGGGEKTCLHALTSLPEPLTANFFSDTNYFLSLNIKPIPGFKKIDISQCFKGLYTQTLKKNPQKLKKIQFLRTSNKLVKHLSSSAFACRGTEKWQCLCAKAVWAWVFSRLDQGIRYLLLTLGNKLKQN